MMILRNYQDYTVDTVLNFDFEMGTKVPLVAAPTGTGKSLMIAGLIKRLFSRYGLMKILVITDVKELIVQDYEKLLQLWPTAPAGIYSAGLKQKDTSQAIIFGGIGSVANVPLYFGKVDFILVDEAHMISMKDNGQYRTFIEAMRAQNPYVCIVGFTATKYRMGQGLLTDGENPLFTDICCDMTTLEAFNWFLDEGYLARLRPVSTKTEYDTTGIRTVAGEYKQADVEKEVLKAGKTEKIIREAISLGQDKKVWLAFASGVKHTIEVAEELNRQGIPTTYIHSNTRDFPMSDAERDQRLADFKAGKYRCMVNNGILTKGYDHPELDYIIMLRLTKSVPLWVQMLGRGTRPYYVRGFDLSTKQGRLDAIANSEKPYCLVADFAGNCQLLGPINDPRIPRAKGKKTAGDAPIRICLNCGTYNHASNSHCDHCGAEFPRILQLEVKASTAELIRENKVAVPPKVEIFKVDRVEYHPWNVATLGKTPSIRVTYYAGLRRFTEWVCLEHTSGVSGRARNWWRGRSTVPPPETIIEAMAFLDTLREPSHVHVRVDTPSPEIMNYDFATASV